MINLKENKKRNILILILAIILIGILTMYLSQAKYVINIKEQHAKSLEKFYLNSSVMKNDRYDLNDWDGVSAYTLQTIDLSQVEDMLRTGNYKIDYIVEVVETVNTNATVRINDVEATQGTITGSNTQNIVVELNPTELHQPMSLRLKISSQAPYAQAFETEFNIYPQTTEDYSAELVEDIGKENITLYVQNNKIEKTFQVKYNNSKLSIDNSLFNDITNISNEEGISTAEIRINKNEVGIIQWIKQEETTVVLGEDIILTIKGE